MGKKPQTIEELKQWLDEHQDDGNINGQNLVNVHPEIVGIEGYTEFAGAFVSAELYNQALLKAAALSFTKSAVGQFALERAIDAYAAEKPHPVLDSREFPCYVPEALVKAAIAKGESIGFTKSDMLTYGLSKFIHDPSVVAAYEAYIGQLMELYNQKREYIEMKILGYWRLRSRQARYSMSLAAGHFIDRRKLIA